MKPERRPWGKYEIMSDFNPPCCVKIITVDPHSKLSLQKHFYRTERWRALDKGLVAVVDGKEIKMRLDRDVFVDTFVEHRIINPTDEPLRLLELMFGRYDEEDIIRIEDDYGREAK